MVGHAALNRAIGVRIPASQPIPDRGCAPKTPAVTRRGPTPGSVPARHAVRALSVPVVCPFGGSSGLAKSGLDVAGARQTGTTCGPQVAIVDTARVR